MLATPGVPGMLLETDAPTVPRSAGNSENIIAERLTAVPTTPTALPLRPQAAADDSGKTLDGIVYRLQFFPGSSQRTYL